MRRNDITKRVRHLMSMAARAAAQGRTNDEIAAALGVTTRAVEHWHTDYPELWQRDFRAAMNEMMAAVRKEKAERPMPVALAELAALDHAAIAKLPDGTPEANQRPNQSAPYSLWEVLDLYGQHHPSIKPRSLDQMQIAVRQFEKWAGRVLLLQDLTDAMLLKFMRDYGKTGVSPSTVNSKRRAIISVWRFARKHRLCKRGPRDVPRVKEVPPMPESWTVEEVSRIFAAVDDLWHRKIVGIPARDWWRSLLLVAYDTGQRIGALQQISPRDISLENGWIVFPAKVQKNGKPMLCRIYPETVEACRAIWSEDREIMWPWSMSRECLYKHIKRIFKSAGVSYGRNRGGLFHKFRRTSGTLVEAAGGDGARHLGNTRAVFERNYKDPRIATTDAAMILPRPDVANIAPGKPAA